uniref:Uncharacterized protein n=1 Tax=Branchiostoma floridae TaxID=7739 RepID=C3YGZ2_BRAFL|eukprot:XP_002604452.1 hypothetical protein BRAFLDRAFT_79248 [Branchiostoma floridae]
MALNEGRFLVIQRAERRNRMEASVYNKMEKVRYRHAQKQLDEARACYVSLLRITVYCLGVNNVAQESSTGTRHSEQGKQTFKLAIAILCTFVEAGSLTKTVNALIYLRYGGLKMDSLKHEVDQMLKDMDPGVRRAKRARKLLEKGRRDGRIRPYDMHSVCLPPIVADAHDEIDIVTAAQDGAAAGEKGPTAEPNRTRLPPLRTLKASVGIDDSDDDL